jgi:hypothetical protein
MAITAEPPLDEEEAPLSVLTADTQAAIDQLRATPGQPPRPAALPRASAATPATGAISAPLPPELVERACRPSRRPWCCTSRTSNGAAGDHRPRSRASSRRSPSTTARGHRGLPSLAGPPDADRPRRRAGRRGRHPPAACVAQPQKTALEIDALRSVVLAIPADLRRRRDRALLLVGWAAALRRSELEPEGVVLTIRRSKTDREGAGASVAVPLGGKEATCPVAALRRWLAAARSVRGASFAGSIGMGIWGRRYRIGRWPRSWRPATAAARAGRSEAAIMRHGRWKSVQIARRYIRQGARWERQPGSRPRAIMGQNEHSCHGRHFQPGRRATTLRLDDSLLPFCSLRCQRQRPPRFFAR